MQESTEEERQTTLYEGIEMTYKGGLSTLKRFNIKQMDDSMGEHFNPEIHDVMFDIPMPG